MPTNTGTVKFFNEEKGYGFIKDDASNKDYFYNHTVKETPILPCVEWVFLCKPSFICMGVIV